MKTSALAPFPISVKGSGISRGSVIVRLTTISSVGSTLCLLLRGVRCASKRARIDAIWIEFEHCVIELARVHCCFVQAVEIAKVLPRLGDDAGIIVVFRHLVPGDHGFRFQGLKLVERGTRAAICFSVAAPRSWLQTFSIPVSGWTRCTACSELTTARPTIPS
jgi:hypothetical protein